MLARCSPFDAIVPKDAGVENVAGGFRFTEGPLQRPSNVLWFSDVVGNVVRQWRPDPARRLGYRCRANAPSGAPAGPFSSEVRPSIVNWGSQSRVTNISSNRL
jgi:sugar lactone lactonase YvrE